MIIRLSVTVAALAAASAVARAEFVPGDLASAGLTRIVDDTTAGDVGGHYGAYAQANWEPYVSVLGTNVFLFESNTYAESAPGVPDLTMMRYALAFQPAAGGAYATGEVFFGDDGNPYRGQVNMSRQDGNPGRVAGDMRPGATNFLAGGEASPHAFPGVFGTMPPGPSYVSGSRYGTVQLYSLDPTTLIQTMASQAIDVLQGVFGTLAQVEVSRFGGELTALSNGNFVAVVDDRSTLLRSYRTPTAIILRPDGTFSIGPDSACTVWSNVAAYRGGFVIRCAACGGLLRFFDNDGNFLGQATQDDPNLKDGLGNRVYFQTNRGDYTRLASHINSDYVFIAGPTTGNAFIPNEKDVVSVAVWDARTRTYVAQANVTEMIPEHGGVGADTDDFATNYSPNSVRVNLAVDALNRVCVVFTRGTVDIPYDQVAARVLKFDPDARAFTHLTPSFWVFLNHCTDAFSACAGTSSRHPSVAMTTRQICVAAKGEINLSNHPELGPDSPYAVNFYTVISHPDPQDDPTPPAGCPGPYGDTDRDGDVDLADFGMFQGCFNGPNRVYLALEACRCLDGDHDGDVDLADFGMFQGCFNGPNRPTACP